MPVQFQFVPTSGDLSGVSFEKQVEQAFNELGEHIDDGSAIAQEALDTANTALTVAQAANTTAQSANTTAQSANTTAQEALNTANAISGTAQDALDTANNALGVATDAQTSADNAQSAADAAQATANQAVTDAATALSTANEANETAQVAAQIANGAAGVYIVTEDSVDADTFFLDAVKLYLTNDTSTNIPVPFPAFFDVILSSDQVNIVQRAFNKNAPQVQHSRNGTVDFSGDDGPVATWGDWELSGGSYLFTPGTILFSGFRPGALPAKWYFCNGDSYALTTDQGAALNALPAQFKTDWGIVVSGSNITLPNMFYSDGRGAVPRTVNGSSRMPGSFEQDAMQPITGAVNTAGSYCFATANGAFRVNTAGAPPTAAGGTAGYLQAALDSALQTRTASETRALNIGMTPIIFLGV